MRELVATTFVVTTFISGKVPSSTTVDSQKFALCLPTQVSCLIVSLLSLLISTVVRYFQFSGCLYVRMSLTRGKWLHYSRNNVIVISSLQTLLRYTLIYSHSKYSMCVCLTTYCTCTLCGLLFLVHFVGVRRVILSPSYKYQSSYCLFLCCTLADTSQVTVYIVCRWDHVSFSTLHLRNM